MKSRAAARIHGWCLWCLLGLFMIRVVAQPLSLIVAHSALPPFSAWQSGALPYPALLTAQVLIVVVCSGVAWTLSSARVMPRRRVGMVLLWVGAVYFATMLLRLVLGATMFRGHWWFARPLPTTFHLVLASFLLVYGHFHARYGSKH
jgi:hypothetical protein